MGWFTKQRNYVSEFTQFIDGLKQQDPQIEERQREGRARLWDKEPLDLEAMRRTQESRVPQRPYVYQSH